MISKSVIRKKVPIMIGISFLLLAIILDRKIDFVDGALLVVGIFVFTWFRYRSSKKDSDIETSQFLKHYKKMFFLNQLFSWQ